MPKITVHEYKENNRDEWEDFVSKSNNGTMFHNQSFLDYHEKGKFNFQHLMFRDGDELLALLPGGLTSDGDVFWSPVGASYGSFVTKDIHFEVALQLVDTFLEFCREKKFKEIYLIPPPIIYSLNYSQHLEFAMLYRKFDFEHHYISHAVHLKHGNNFLAFFDKTARKTIHRILREKRLTIRESDDFETFNHILINNKAKHNIKPTHTLEDMLRLNKLMPENIRLNMVYLGDIPIAGSLLFLCNKKVVLCFYNMLLYEYEELKPVYLIMFETVRWAVENGYEWVDIGVSQDTSATDPMTPAQSLICFKERFNARGILRSTYHFKL